ncbi:hypothetical protein [Devosia sp.]|uniref:hypothetical protein n=1 Tax=Devosia sp. TaxID=1871048 RepID=UPI0035AE1900
MVTPRLLLRIRSGLKRLDPRARSIPEPQPADEAWYQMLRRLDAQDSERRLAAMERRLNAGAER